MNTNSVQVREQAYQWYYELEKLKAKMSAVEEPNEGNSVNENAIEE